MSVRFYKGGPESFRSKPVDANDDLIKVADLSLINPCPINGLVTARSVLSPQVGQIEVGGNSELNGKLCKNACCKNFRSMLKLYYPKKTEVRR